MLRKGDELIPGYRMEKFLGRGQFGEVWRTTAPGGTSAALKFISLSGKQGLKEYRGIRRVKEIRHAHLMPITALWMLDALGNILSDEVVESYNPEVREPRGTLLLPNPASQRTDNRGPEWLVVAMLLGDKNLLDRLEEHTAAGRDSIPLDELLRYLEESAKGIDFLNTAQHDLGEGPISIQHCDIKPANIMLVGDSVLICDFGLARMLSDVAATATGMVGSPAYMPPECINRRPSHASDQYSLAITYVELRTGHLPFAEETCMAILDAHTKGTLDLSRLPPKEQEIIRKATAVNPDDRYPSSLDMVRALKKTIDGDAAKAGQRPRKLMLAAVAALLCIGGLVGGYFATRTQNGGPEQPARPTVPVVAQKSKYTLAFDPPDLTVSINGVEKAPSADGELEIELADDDTIDVTAWHSDNFERLERSYTTDLLKQSEFRITLEHSARYYADRARKQLADGERRAAVESYKQAIRLDAALATPTPFELRQHTAAVRGLVISGDGRRLVSACDDGTGCVWELGTDKPADVPKILHGHGADQPIESVSISADGRWAVTGSWDDTAIVWDLQSADPAAAPVVLRGHSEDVVAVLFSPDGKWIITASFDSTLRLWGCRNGPPKGEPLVLTRHESEIERVAISGDGRWLVSIDADGQVYRWDLNAENPAAQKTAIFAPPHRVRACLISGDGAWLVTGGDDGKVVFSHLLSKLAAKVLPERGDAIESLATDVEGRCLLAGGADGAVRFWKLTGPAIASNSVLLDRHAGPVVAMAVSDDGQWAVTGGWDKACYLWDLATDSPSTSPLRLPGHGGEVHAVALSHDGRWAATADEDGLILLWHLPECKMIQQAASELDLDSPGRIQA